MALVGVTCILSGCSRFAGVNSKSAVQAAIEAHLKKRPGLALSNMTTEIKDVKFEGDKANAQVVYVSKDSPDLRVEVRYVLQRQGDQWVVESSSPMGGAGGNPHGGMTIPESGEMSPHAGAAAPSAVPAPQASH